MGYHVWRHQRLQERVWAPLSGDEDPACPGAGSLGQPHREALAEAGGGCSCPPTTPYPREERGCGVPGRGQSWGLRFNQRLRPSVLLPRPRPDLWASCQDQEPPATPQPQPAPPKMSWLSGGRRDLGRNRLPALTQDHSDIRAWRASGAVRARVGVGESLRPLTASEPLPGGRAGLPGPAGFWGGPLLPQHQLSLPSSRAAGPGEALCSLPGVTLSFKKKKETSNKTPVSGSVHLDARSLVQKQRVWPRLSPAGLGRGFPGSGSSGKQSPPPSPASRWGLHGAPWINTHARRHTCISQMRAHTHTNTQDTRVPIPPGPPPVAATRCCFMKSRRIAFLDHIP